MAKLIRMCPSCNSRKLRRHNIYKYGGRTRVRYKCQNCGRLTIYPLIKLVAERKKKKK
jgi:transposase-like protein